MESARHTSGVGRWERSTPNSRSGSSSSAPARMSECQHHRRRSNRTTCAGGVGGRGRHGGHTSVVAAERGGVRGAGARLCRHRGCPRPVPCAAAQIGCVQSVSLCPSPAFMTDRPRSLRRRPCPAPFLSPRSPSHLLQGCLLQHPHRNLAHKRLPSPPPDFLCRPHPGHARSSEQARRSQRQMHDPIRPRLAQKARGLSLPSVPIQPRSPCPSPAISPLCSKRCRIISPVPPLFTPNPSRLVPVQPHSPSPPLPPRLPSPCHFHNLATMIGQHCHRNPCHPRRLCPHALSLPQRHLPLDIHKYAHFTLKRSLNHDRTYRLTYTIGRRRLCPSNLVQISVHPNINNRYFLRRACILATEILRDQPSNSPENHPLPQVLITAHQSLRTHFRLYPPKILQSLF